MDRYILILTDTFEEVEALTQVDYLRRADIKVDIISIMRLDCGIAGTTTAKVSSGKWSSIASISTPIPPRRVVSMRFEK